jgi:hypothetical protein
LPGTSILPISAPRVARIIAEPLVPGEILFWRQGLSDFVCHPPASTPRVSGTTDGQHHAQLVSQTSPTLSCSGT